MAPGDGRGLGNLFWGDRVSKSLGIASTHFSLKGVEKRSDEGGIHRICVQLSTIGNS